MRPDLPQRRNYGWSYREDHGVGTLALRGEVDLATYSELLDDLRSSIAEGPDTVVIDLREVEFIDSSGLRLLLDLRRVAMTRGCRLVLREPSERVLSVLRVSGLDTVFDFAD